MFSVKHMHKYANRTIACKKKNTVQIRNKRVKVRKAKVGKECIILVSLYVREKLFSYRMIPQFAQLQEHWGQK
jgi:hypothetical protein